MKAAQEQALRARARTYLIRAKAHLARDAHEMAYHSKARCICWAIALAKEGRCTPAEVYMISDLLWARLGGTASLEEWLWKNHGISKYRFPPTEYRNKVQETRHAWIDSLIEELS